MENFTTEKVMEKNVYYMINIFTKFVNKKNSDLIFLCEFQC